MQNIKKIKTYFISKLLLLVAVVVCLPGSLYSQKLFPFKKKDKWGYLNFEGKIVIDAKYDYAEPFNDGNAVVALNNLPCLIDLKENRLIDTGLYQYIGRYSNGLAPVMDYKFRRFYLNNKSKKIITLDSTIYDARPFNKGIARVGKKIDVVEHKFGVDISNLGYKFAYIKTDGSYLTGFDFDDADDFIDDVARILNGMKFGLIDTSGKIVLEPKYFNIGPFSDSLAVVDANSRYGYINKKGVEIIKPQFDYATTFNGGFAAVEVAGKYGYINKSGELVIPAQYDEVRPFGSGLAAVRSGKLWGIINAKGEYIFNPRFEDAAFFSEGLCPVKLSRKWGAIDKEGKIVAPFEYDFIGIFEDGVAEVIYRDINLYLNLRGELLPKSKN